MAVQGYLEKRESLRRPSGEETYSLELIGTALDSGLALARPNTYFVAQEWRLPSGAKIDLIAVDPDLGRLVVVELKSDQATANALDPKKGGDAWAQAKLYAQEIQAHRAELYPFFQRLARALARHHGAAAPMLKLELDPDLLPEIAVSWPGGGFQ